VDAAIAATTPQTAAFQDFVTRYAWGEVWARAGLSRRERSIATLASLVTGGHHAELRMHVRAALRNGLTPDEIAEVVLHTALYAGLPAANAALAVARDVFTEIQGEGHGQDVRRELRGPWDADEHADAGLLCQQRPQRADAIVDVGGLRRLHDRLLMGRSEPAPRREGLVEDALDLRGGSRDEVLRRTQAIGIGERLHGGVDLRVRVRAVRHGRHHRQVAIPLTSLSHGAGCGCKVGAAELGPIVAGLALPADPAVLVGPQTADDAGVYLLRDDLAPIHTADFLHADRRRPLRLRSHRGDERALRRLRHGGTPETALNLVAFSLEELGADVLREILRGGADAAAEAGAAVVGGHTIDDREPKYGMAVTGTVHPDARC
jgi:alkylhydroperoxidase/carboxymuconolactone decarboxylase family protein YurZ